MDFISDFNNVLNIYQYFDGNLVLIGFRCGIFGDLKKERFLYSLFFIIIIVDIFLWFGSVSYRIFGEILQWFRMGVIYMYDEF